MRTFKHLDLYLPYGLMMLVIIACNPDPITEPPLPPPPVPDCSQNVTVPTADTLVHPPPYQGVTQPDYIYYEGYALTDISFNPNDPNQLVVAIEVHRSGVIPEITANGGSGVAIVRIDLCNGAEQVIFASELSPRIRCVDWGTNDKIIFVTAVQSNSVFFMNSDGTDLVATDVPINYYQADNIRWSLNSNGFTLIYGTSNLYHFNNSGQPIQDTLGLLAQDFDYLPDGKIGYIGSGIGIFDPQTGSSEILDASSYVSSRYDVAYSEKHNALFWAVDTVVGLTNVETGQTTLLKDGGNDVVIYNNTAASTNGYLAYKAYVISPTLSTNSTRAVRTELRFINADGTDERRLVLDFQ